MSFFQDVFARPLIEKGDLRIFSIEMGINDLSSMNAHLGNKPSPPLNLRMTPNQTAQMKITKLTFFEYYFHRIREIHEFVSFAFEHVYLKFNPKN